MSTCTSRRPRSMAMKVLKEIDSDWEGELPDWALVSSILGPSDSSWILHCGLADIGFIVRFFRDLHVFTVIQVHISSYTKINDQATLISSRLFNSLPSMPPSTITTCPVTWPETVDDASMAI